MYVELYQYNVVSSIIKLNFNTLILIPKGQ